MAVTLDALTDGDFVEVDDADSVGNWTASGAMSMDSLSTVAPVEGTGAIECRVNAGVAELLISRGSQDMENTHLRGWLKLAQGLETVALGGARLRIGDLTDYGEWNIYGSDKQITVYNGWMALCVDILRPFDDVLGTPPAITAILDSGFRINWLNGNGKDLDVADRVWFGNLLFIEGGTTGDRGTFAEIVVDDESNGYGLIRPTGGVFFANSECAFGEEGTATSFFEDSNEVLIFEDLPVSGALYKIRHAANSTGTNHVRFGASSGSGIDKEGTSGMTIKSAGAAPFRIEAIDAEMNVADYFGCSLTGPAALYDDALRNIKVEDNGTGFTDVTRDANYPYSAGASITSSSIANPSNILCAGAHGFRNGADVVISGHSGSTPDINATHQIIVVDPTNFTIPVNVTVGGTGGSVVSGQIVSAMPATQADSDATYFGHDERFYELNIHLTVAKGGTWTGVWEYFNGSTWELLTDLTDGTANYATTGAQVVTYSIPDDWAANAIDTDTRYWIRFRIDSFSSSGTTPVLANASAAMAGDVRLEDAVVEMIGSTLTQMGSVRVRNGAFLKKTLITDSIVPAKHAALDLGGADPSINTVRDLTIQNCSKGILLKGSGDVTYNFRNIKFAGNTNDVRIDFGGGDTITINILEDGDSPTVDNVNSSTVIINNAVSVKVQGVTEGTPIKIIARETVGTITIGDVLQTTFADETGTTDLSFNYEGAFDPSGLDVQVIARNSGIATACIADDGGALTDETDEGHSNSTADMTILPTTPAGNDQYFFGHTEQFTRLKLDISTALVQSATPTVTWQYWDGDSWEPLTGVVDGTNIFQNTGETIVSWTLPGDWATSTENSQGPFYYVRARLTTLGTITTAPIGRKVTLDVSRYLPYVADRIILPAGLTDNAVWTLDQIGKFS